ncbi:AbrB/MazE/SpoVT family DNA-binding domain-containing protein [Endozoicomonas sp. 4G]|uniref:AbrB/MazE/SpoVT family DNA-binding domain-containing protein n=1 Tax=Endozoicomonas sp. 4G TaxID=2872754 RepID=UPI00207861C0|nr:AbrB/MazE/SpoVT family DNA-binding domain-containing protein [Endozoicomonas sp. 4G]
MEINIVSATVTSKGQVTIPATIRNTLKISPGDQIQFVEVTPGRFEMLVACNDVKSLKGMVKSNRHVSIKEINQAIKFRGRES